MTVHLPTIKNFFNTSPISANHAEFCKQAYCCDLFACKSVPGKCFKLLRRTKN